jgi:acyl carrier protein
MESVALEERIQVFIYKQFPMAKKLQVNSSDSLFSLGVIDSLGVLDLVRFLENEFCIEISDEELIPENFETVKGIANFLEQNKHVKG